MMTAPKAQVVDMTDPRAAMRAAGWGGEHAPAEPPGTGVGRGSRVAEAVNRLFGGTQVEEQSGEKPKKRRKKNGGPTETSIARQNKRLEQARDAIAEAVRHEELARAFDATVKIKGEEIEAAKRATTAAKREIKTAKGGTKKSLTKAKALRAKAAKLAKG